MEEGIGGQIFESEIGGHSVIGANWKLGVSLWGRGLGLEMILFLCFRRVCSEFN